MGASMKRALNSATSALKKAEGRLKGDPLDAPNKPLPLRTKATGLTQFLASETQPDTPTRWVPLRSVFPAQAGCATDAQVRSTARDLIKTSTAGGPESLPAVAADFHLGIEWGGEIFGAKSPDDARALAAYAAMGLPFVPVAVAATYQFIDAQLSLPFPAVKSPVSRMRRASSRLSQSLGLKTRETKTRQGQATENLWRIHDCLRDFLLEGELVRDDSLQRFTATIKSTSLFPWLFDDRLAVIGEAFAIAYPNQTRHGKVPTPPRTEVQDRAQCLPPSISSED